MSYNEAFTARPIDEVYEELDTLPPQTSVEIGPGLSMKLKENGVPVIRLHYDAIPERNRVLNPVWSAAPEDRVKYGLNLRDWKAVNERSKYTQSGWDREFEIDDEAGGGDRLFASTLSMFGKLIVITDPEWWPKKHWKVVGGFDHGKTNATALERAYVDELGNIYLCGEFYQMRTENYQNNIWQNIPIMKQMPDLHKMQWCRADPSIFFDKEAQTDGTFTNINAIYRKNGFTILSKFPGENREDLTMEERLNDHWRDLTNRKPSLFIVCRNESDRLQPGLHPWDCPNLLWELRRMRRMELTSRQLLTRNATEKIVDKWNHAWDALKYMVLSLPKPADIPVDEQLNELTKGLDPTSAQITAERFVKRQGGFQIFQEKRADPFARRPVSKPLSLRDLKARQR